MKRRLAGAAAVLLGGCSALLDLAPPQQSADATTFTPLWSFADDFDLGDFRLWTQVVSSTNGSIEVTSGDSVSGCCALHAVVAGGSGTGFEYALLTWPQATPNAAPVTSGSIAMRARVKALQLADDTRELTVDQGATDATAFATSGLGTNSTSPGLSWGFVLSDPADQNDTRQSANVIGDALGGWHCIEVVIDVASAGYLAIFMDGSPIPQIDGAVSTLAGVGWDSAEVGLGYASGSSPTDVLIDDVAIALYADTDRAIHIGCN
ncbi:MAG TPA: hypothetical protein VH143_03500 [Kofleriaceae bacterium]|nr:hypothetical protein [Kofleriaceae bacterium]